MTNDSSFLVSTDQTRLDISMIHRFLSEQSSWAVGITRPVLERAIENSLCFGGILQDRQIAFARVVTDYSTTAFLTDTFVVPEFRGLGYGEQLLAVVMAHPSLQALRRFMVYANDTHELFVKHGFTPLEQADALLERYYPNMYVS